MVAKDTSGVNILGSWSTTDSSVQVIPCNGTFSNGITQTSSTNKSQIQATWSSPSNVPQGNIVIEATIVQAYKKFYVNCFNITLTPQLGDDHVFACERLSDDTIHVQRFVNLDGYSPPVLVTAASNYGGIFQVSRVAQNNGVIYCEFTLSNFTNTLDRRTKRSISLLSQNKQYQILTAIGNLDSSNSLIQHFTANVLTQMIQLNQSETIMTNNTQGSTNNKTILLRAHGIIMLFLWMLFVPAGILLARYFRQSWSKLKLCAIPVWYIMHQIVMNFAVVMTLVSFVLILIYKRGVWTSQSLSREFAHSIMGLIVVSTATLQSIMTIFRCRPDHPRRFIFNYVHRIVGISTLILSSATILLATLLSRYDSVKMKPWRILVVWWSMEFVIWIGIECLEIFYRKYWSRFDTINLVQPMQTNSLHDGGQLMPINARPSSGNIFKERFKTFLFILHILVACGLSIVLTVYTSQIS
ncbi:unnamed protein product [Rotaria sp. Silwood2]|nr:unnamed protein product [Rotaria sp. Silwood2]CAF4230724.1 unnamed protein product [Rotaria sp. Silwood2]